uniref:Uncharacterized protein n=1 Tax=Rhizophora mucronata TaxID=61149 RepID=A0A2P2NH74_RHIMU
MNLVLFQAYPWLMFVDGHVSTLDIFRRGQ